MRELCDDPRSGRIRRVGVCTQTLFLVTVRDRDLMGKCVLTSFKIVLFGLSPVKTFEADACDGTLVGFVHTVVYAFHKLVNRGHEVGKVVNPMVEPLKATDDMLQPSSVCGRFQQQQAVHATRVVVGIIGSQKETEPTTGSCEEGELRRI